MSDRVVRVVPLAREHAEAIATWRYADRDAIYDPSSDDLLHADAGYWALVDGAGDFVGFCCYGAEARVPGLEDDPDTLDIGVGLRPDLVGRGYGAAVTAAALGFAGRWPARAWRVAVHAWNQRAQRTVQRAGFTATGSVTTADGRTFAVLERPAG